MPAVIVLERYRSSENSNCFFKRSQYGEVHWLILSHLASSCTEYLTPFTFIRVLSLTLLSGVWPRAVSNVVLSTIVWPINSASFVAKTDGLPSLTSSANELFEVSMELVVLGEPARFASYTLHTPGGKSGFTRRREHQQLKCRDVVDRGTLNSSNCPGDIRLSRSSRIVPAT